MCREKYFLDPYYFWTDCTQFPLNYYVPFKTSLFYMLEIGFYLQVGAGVGGRRVRAAAAGTANTANAAAASTRTMPCSSTCTSPVWSSNVTQQRATGTAGLLGCWTFRQGRLGSSTCPCD